MIIIEVNNNKKYINEFLKLPVELYKNQKTWIRPLDTDIEDVFDSKKNKYFRHGECTRWILKDDKGKTIGRIAAFIDRKISKTHEQPTGGIGFFECIDDYDAAALLFYTCQKWLSERGMEAMDGPINFGDRDKWWGLQIDGYEVEPVYGMFYHFPYYKFLFERYGFKEYFQQYTFSRGVYDPLSEKILYKAELIAKDKAYSFEHIKKSELERFAEHFRIVYNKAWVKHKGVGEMPKAQAMLIMNKLKPVIDEKIIWFAYYNNEPVAFFIMLPELNQIFKHVNGKFNLFGKLIFLWHKFFKTTNKMFGVAFGVIPEHQGKGLEGAIIMAAAKVVQSGNLPYKTFEMNWIGDFNPKMLRIAEQVGGRVVKKHATYRKLFDETKEFKRHPIIL